MTVREIVLYPDPRLRQVCKPVTELDDSVKRLLDDMAETMYEAPGLGLAAPQIGVLTRAIVVDVGDEPETGRKRQLYQLVNPTILTTEGEVDSEEGCLSIPNIRETITRHEILTVEATNIRGEKEVIEADGLLAICLQHEIDHINGVLFIDHLSRLKRQLVNSKLKKIAKQQL